MKQSTFSAVMANSIKNLLQGYTKGIRFVAVLTMLLTMGIGQAWGADFQGQGTNAGWISGANDEGLILSWSKNSSSATTKMKYSTLSSGGNLGDITTGLTLTKFEAKFWRVYAYGNICDATLFWELYKGNSKISNGSESSTSFGSWSGNNCSISKTLSIDFLSKTTGPGSYTIRIYGKLTGRSQNNKYDDPSYLGCGDNFWYNNNNSGYYSITFTIPSKNLTVAGAANGNTVSGTVAGITKGKAYTITATPTIGYSFSKWTASSGASSITIANANAASTTVTFKDYANNATVTASFSAKTYNVTLDNQGATTAGQASVTATYNAAMPSIANNLPNKTGYTFNGYFDAASGGTQYYKADGTSARTWNKTANTTLYAQWTLNTYSVKWFVDGKELTGAATTVAHGSKVTTIPEVDLNTYCEGSDVLAGWTTAPMENASVTAPAQLYKTIDDFPTAEGPQTFYAVFADYE